MGDTLADFEGGLQGRQGPYGSLPAVLTGHADRSYSGSLVGLALRQASELRPIPCGLRDPRFGNLASVSQSLFVNVEVLFRIVAEGFP